MVSRTFGVSARRSLTLRGLALRVITLSQHNRTLRYYSMERLWHGLKWLWGTSWPLYAATVLGTNVVGALAIMLFVRYFIPVPDVDQLTLQHLSLIHI
mgnify:CR=1 FL=1